MSYWGHDDEKYWSKFPCKCDSCGKTRHLTKHYIYWFDTMDGGDSMASVSCWQCEIIDTIHRYKHKIKKYIKAYKVVWDFKRDYIQMSKDLGVKMTKERKQNMKHTLRKIKHIELHR